MRSCEWSFAAIGLIMACSCPLAAGQSNQEWIALKQKCGIPANEAYNDWVAAGAKCNSGSATTGTAPDSAERLGTMLGNSLGDAMVQGFNNLLHGPTPKPSAPMDPAQQQRALAAQQLNNSGIYLLNRKPRDYAGAINEFQKALQQAPDNAVIAKNLQFAVRLQKESVAAGQTSDMLQRLLNNNALPANANNNIHTAISPNVFNPGNLDSSVVDFRGMPQNSRPGTPHSHLPSANANALNAVLSGSNAGVVDMRGTTKTSIDPKSVQNQIDALFRIPAPAAEPPVPTVAAPQVQEIDKLFQRPQPTAGSLRSATDSKPADGKKQTNAQKDGTPLKPAPPPHN